MQWLRYTIVPKSRGGAADARVLLQVILFLGVSGCQTVLPDVAFNRSVDVAYVSPAADKVAAELPNSETSAAAPIQLARWQGAPAPEELPLPAGLPAPTQERTLDLDTAIRLAGFDNPTIGLADEVVQLSLAERMQARALLWPMLNAGANLRVHRGSLLTSNGTVRSEDTQSLYGGFGADVKGGGTIAVPGVHLISHIADAVYAPRIAERKLTSAGFDAVATRHEIFYQVARTYVALAGAQAQLSAFRQSRKEFEELARLTGDFARAGQGRDADFQRERAELLLLVVKAEHVVEEEAVVAAELSALLDLDPAVRLRAADALPPLLEMIDPQLSLTQLLEIAQAQHPELAARAAEVSLQDARLRQERARPWLPTLSVGFSAGEFGGGNQNVSPHLGNFRARTDFDARAVWTIENLGAGNRAVQNRVRAEREQARAEELRVADRIRRDVTQAYALVQTRRRELESAQKRIDTAQRAFNQDLTRTKNLQGRVIEVINSMQQLANARQDLVRAMVDASHAQMQLAVALGMSLAP